ncbi:MAG: response regulator [Silicimonas sp.]|nr:response regulator [Silicimonas sp.]
MVLLMFVASTLSIVITNFRTSNQIQQELEEVARTIQPQIAEVAWELDYELLESFLSAQLLSNKVVAATVNLDDGFQLNLGEIEDADNVLSVSLDLVWQGDSRTENLGEFTLYGTRLPAVELGIRRATALTIISTVAISLTFLGIYFSLRQRFIRPIEELEKVLLGIDPNVDSSDIKVSARSESKMVREVESVIGSVRAMHDRMTDFRDELSESQRQLGRAAQISGIGYAAIDGETGAAVKCDKHFAAIVGSTVEKILSQNFFDNHEPPSPLDQTPKDRKERLDALMRGRTLIENFKFRRSDGGINHARLIIEPTMQPGRTAPLLEMAIFDDTDSHEAEERAQHAEKMQAIGKLTGGVAHDFNNVLAIISGNLELIEDATSLDEVKSLAEVAITAVDRGASITSQLLSFARKHPQSPKVLNPARLLSELEPLLKVSAGAQIDIELVRDSGLWAIFADPEQLQAAIINLVVNARDAMQNGGNLTIECSNTRIDQEYADDHQDVEAGQYVCISVSDNGAGMPPDVLESAFEPFFTTKPAGIGTGLGLSMIYGFIKQSRGHAKIYSEVDHGTTVKLYFPRSHEEIVAPVDLKVPSPKPGLRGVRVLLVEDDTDLQRVFVKQLVSIGCVVESAGSSTEALELCKSIEPPDVILTDVILGEGMNGKALAMQVRETFRDIKVIYMSGFTENAIIHGGTLDSGCVFLQKPFNLATLTAVMSKVVLREG